MSEFLISLSVSPGDKKINHSIKQFSPLPAIDSFPAPLRYFLLFTAINVVSWQCIAGQALVLFARAVGMPPTWVGVLLSFLPLSSVLVAFAVPLVEWLGPRRLLISTWLSRNLVAFGIFFMPWAITTWGQKAGWQTLLVVTLAFSIIRAIGVGGWFPWLYEIVPQKLLGAYFSVESAMTNIINIVLAMAMARILAGGEGLERFFWIYAIGIGAGLVSVFFIERIPGGGGLPATLANRPRNAALRIALADRGYLHFIGLAVGGLVALTWLNSAMIMYLRDILRYTETHIMLLLAGGGVGVACTVHFWGRSADRYGSVPAMIQLLTAHTLFAGSWLALGPDNRGTGWLVLPIVICSTLFNAAFSAVTARGMLCRVREQGKVGYTTLWMVCSSLAIGITPIAAGRVIELWGINGFRFCFLASALTGLCALSFMFRLPPEEGKPPLHTLHHLIHPAQPLRSLARIFWITIGFGEEK